MKFRRKIGLLVISSAIAVVAPSCKKGVNDPALTLLTRKARLDNQWKIFGFKYEWKVTDGSDYDSGIDIFDQDTVLSTWESYTSGSLTSGNGPDTVYVIRNEWDINKDGTFSKIWNTLTVSTNKPTMTITVVDYKIRNETLTGTWSFVGDEDAYKNKERILFHTTSQLLRTQTTTDTYFGASVNTQVNDTLDYESTFAIGEVSEMWEIDRLKSHEITLKSLENSSTILTVTDTSGIGVPAESSIRSSWTVELIERE